MMNVVAPALLDAADADARMTSRRQETKLVIPLEAAQATADAFDQELRPHRYAGEGANHLPGADHFVTTIYFDTPSRHLFRQAQAVDSNLKLRAREYYDLHPALIDVATDPAELVRYHPVLWLEVKYKDGEHTRKRRLAIPKVDVRDFFVRGRITAEMVMLQRQHHGAASADMLAEVAAICGRHGEPFQADCLVNYRRLAWQDDAGTLRLTLDVHLAFYRPPADLFDRRQVLVREGLGTAVGREARCVLEVKTLAAPPGWLARVLESVSARRVAYSKFIEASRTIHG